MKNYTHNFLVDSKIKFKICEIPSINADLNPNGIILSKNYPTPTIDINSQCSIKLLSSNTNKAFKIYITDIELEDEYIQL